ncbi:hypothetical protein SCL_0381 [Sulfuricaulis limicola]|uniref:Uncharacterized protein n=1 Tax=Sulfuricaulis limicola TaxID=1620215 RepID=A0A1B4XD11_9GAMM|nr:hypothetical protein [Sulfuricaulis limicola]BAV32703.1 hypothetical protein SCL_0381 [Sulfuricaulis limicola]
MLNAPRYFSHARASRGSPAAGQRGFLLIAAVVLIVVAALLLSVTVWFPVVDNQATVRHLGSKQALFIAGSGIERGIRQWSLDNSYAGEGPVSFGEGSFTVTTHDDDFQGAALPATKKRIRSVGQVADTGMRVVEVIARRTALFLEQFPGSAGFAADWPTQILTNNEGSSGFDAANCPVATCPDTLAGSGSMLIRTTPAGPNDRVTGYREQALATPVVTGAGGLTVDIGVAFDKSGGNVNTNTVSVRLFDSAANVLTSVWSDSALTTAGWVLDEVTGVVLPANRHYDRIRLYFDLREQGNNTVVTRLDEIKLSSTGAGLAVQEAWREVYQ